MPRARVFYNRATRQCWASSARDNSNISHSRWNRAASSDLQSAWETSWMVCACRPGGRACQNPAVSDLNYLADCLRRIPSYQIYSQSTFATGVPDRTSAPASDNALPRISILPRRQYQLLAVKVRLAALLGHGSDLSMFEQCAPAVRCCPHTGSAPQRRSY
jgi:hypothetical protein